MDELKPSEKLVGTLRIQADFHHYEADRPGVLTADAPNLSSVTGFQDCVAKAAQNQGPCYKLGSLTFDKEDCFHKPRFFAASEAVAVRLKIPVLRGSREGLTIQ